MSELRFTDTNSANDSKGRALGLEGNDFYYVVGGVIGALAIYLVLVGVLHVRVAIGLMFSVPVLVGPIVWVLLLRHNKPEGYTEDLFDQLVNGEGWSYAPRAQPVSRMRPSHDQRRT